MGWLNTLVDKAKSALEDSPQKVSDLANKVWALVPKRMKQRALEVAFRTDKDANVQKTLDILAGSPGQNTYVDYILTGNDKGDKRNRSGRASESGTYNSDVEVNRANMSYNGMGYYRGEDKPSLPGANTYTNDMIDAVIYGKQVDPTIGRQLTDQEIETNPYKTADQYIITQPKNVPTYSQAGITPITLDNGKKYSGAHGYFMTESGYPIDNAGTVNQYGTRNDSIFVRGFDKWGLNTDDASQYSNLNVAKQDRQAGIDLMNKAKDLTHSVSVQTPWVYIGDADKYGIHQGSIEMVKQYGNSNAGSNYLRLLNWIKSSGSEISPMQYNTNLKKSQYNEEGDILFRSAFPEITDSQIADYSTDYKKTIYGKGGRLNYFNYFK